jgi:alpha-1,2-mannosyltransferase
MDLYSAAAWLLYASAALVVAAVTTRLRRALRKRTVVAFLHPYAAQGGGGERVLWVAIAALRRARPDVRIVVYSGDGLSAAELASHARERFGVAVPADLAVQRVASRRLTHAKTWPVATMAGQALGAVVLAAESVMRLPPDVLVDTTGLAFGVPLAKLLSGCRAAAYVHYPAVSQDMLDALDAPAFNNARRWTGTLGRRAKAAYYRALGRAYGWCGRRHDVVLANSTWTRGHIAQVWGRDATLAYPPCGAMQSLPPRREGDSVIVMSLAQFRPEKDHALQLEAWALVPRPLRRKAKLVIAGAARHADDRVVLDALRAKAATLGLDDVEFLVGAPRDVILARLASASIGLHTMRLEHFGIAVVEFMAAGLVPVAHASGGPLLDIVGETGERGFVARDAAEYAAKLASLLAMDAARRRALGDRARAFVVDRFSDERFGRTFVAALVAVMPPFILAPRSTISARP